MKMKIGDISTYIKRGITPKYVVENGYAVVNQKCIRDGKVNYEYIKYTDIHKKYNEEKKVKQGDILINSTGTGTLGRVAYVDKDASYTYVDSHVTILRCENYNSKFLYYWLSSLEKYIESLGKGSTNQIELNKDTIEEIEIPKLNLEQQNIVVENLSTYDDLIENNQKQIKLLEEAAQRLYKEWFVNLHFPGYEDVEIVAGVPEGWTEGTLEDVAPFKRGKTITKVQVHDGDVPVVAGGLEPAYYHNVSNTVAPVITVSGSGANAGYARLYNVNVFASDCSFVDSNSTPYLFYVYCFIKDNKDRFNALKKGSAQPHVYAKDINALEALIPTNKLIEEFCSIASQYFEKIKILQMQIQLSTQARDRLLPKLMSGEIEV